MVCHTPAKQGKPLKGLTLSGGEVFRFSGMVVVSANITPDPQTGIGRWSEQDFLDRIYQYKEYVEKGSPQTGPESFTLMPWLTFAQLSPRISKRFMPFCGRSSLCITWRIPTRFGRRRKGARNHGVSTGIFGG